METVDTLSLRVDARIEKEQLSTSITDKAGK